MSNIVMFIAFVIWGETRMLPLVLKENIIVVVLCRIFEVMSVGTILTWLVSISNL